MPHNIARTLAGAVLSVLLSACASDFNARERQLLARDHGMARGSATHQAFGLALQVFASPEQIGIAGGTTQPWANK